jgi:ribosomal protein L21
MLAVIEIGGNQFTVQVGDIIETKRQDIEVEENMTLEALLVSDLEGKKVQVGTPLVS